MGSFILPSPDHVQDEWRAAPIAPHHPSQLFSECSPADGMSAAATNGDFGTSRWLLLDEATRLPATAEGGDRSWPSSGPSSSFTKRLECGAFNPAL